MDKSELKKQYKQTIQPMGVYCIKNLVNGKVFIGFNKNINARINRHKFELDHGSEGVSELLDDYRKFGVSNFTFEILDLLEPKEDPAYDYTEDLITLNSLWLEKIEPYGNKGYNEKE